MISSWLCEKCGRARSTKFCHDCGAEAPVVTEKVLGYIEDLKLLLVHLRRNERSQFNASNTWRTQGFIHNAEQSFESYCKWREYANACEWALEKILLENRNACVLT